MKWRAPSKRVQDALVQPIAVVAVILTAPVWIWLIGWLLLFRWLEPSGKWHRWFAWRPVPLGHWSEHFGNKRGPWAWLEFVERRKREYHHDCEYRAITVEGGAQ